MRLSLVFGLLLLSASTCVAQLRNGIFFQGHGGGAFVLSGMEDHLRGESILGEQLSLPGFGYQYGGKVYGLVGGRFTFGGQISASGLAERSTTSGSADYRSLAIMFQLGLVKENADGWLIYPYVGLGAITTTLTLTDAGLGGVAFDPGNPLLPTETQEYQYSGLGVELGLKLDYILDMPGSALKPVFSLEAGVQFGPFGGDWEDNRNQRIAEPPTPVATQVFLRLSVGGAVVTY